MIGGIITFLIGIGLAIWYFTRKYMTADEDYPWHDPSAGEPDMHKMADMMAEYERKNRILLMVGPIIIAAGLLQEVVKVTIESTETELNWIKY